MDCIDRALIEVTKHAAALTADRARRRRTEAPDFNIFDFLRDDEYGLSSVIAWMLDPSETHGQGDRFLQIFLSTFQIQVELGDRPVVVTMETATHLLLTNSRRIDVHVRMGDYVLAIENKPWAQWQKDQVRDYLRQIEAEAKEGHCLVVVRGYGEGLPENQLTSQEREELIERGHLVDADYPLLRTWALACADECEAARVKMMLNEFADMIATSFGVVKMTTDDQALADRILGSDNIDAALRLMSAADAVLAKLADRCHARILALAQNRLKVGPERPDPLTRYEGFSFELDADAPFIFCVEFDKLRLTAPYFGLKLRESANTRQPYPAIKAAVESQGIKAGRCEWYWIWWDWAEEGVFGLREENVAETWQALADGSFAQMAVDAALRLDKALRDAGVLPWVPQRFKQS